MTLSYLQLIEVSVFFQKRVVLQNVSLNLMPGQIVTLIGPNGAGKTTLIKVILGLQKLDQGNRQLRPNLKIGYMPQKLNLNRNMPLNVERFLSLTGRDFYEIKKVLLKVGVESSLKMSIHSLSGGELQRVLLARALLSRPQLLVLDEPAQGVDVNGQQELYRLITAIRDESGCAVLMVSHDLHLVMASTDHVVCLNQHICCSGHPQHVKKHPEFLKMFYQPTDLALYNHYHDHQHTVDGSIQSFNERLK